MSSKSNNTASKNTSISSKDILAYNMEYFKIVSSQRMQMFNFYIVIETALMGGFFTLTQLESLNPIIEIICLLISTLVSISFLGIDIRNQTLLKNITNAIKTIEKTFPSVEMGVLHQENQSTRKRFIIFTYSFWIRFLYSTITLLGLILIFLIINGFL